MSDGQWRVLFLIGLLLVLEVLRSGPVKSFFTTLVKPFKGG